MQEISTAGRRAPRRYGRLRIAAALAAVALVCVGCKPSGPSHASPSHSASTGGARPTSSSSSSASASAPGVSPSSGGGGSSSADASAAAAVKPLTDTGSKDKGVYFSDPYPIHLAPSSHGIAGVYFSGTTKSLLTCTTGSSARCTTGSKVTMTAGAALKRAAAKYGSRTTAADNFNIYQLDSGAWEMAATMYVKNPHFANAPRWTVIVHAHGSHAGGNSVPTTWVADSLLAGSFQRPDKADYDGKYFQDGKKLYLIYSKRLSQKPAHDGIVAQAMTSAVKPAKSAPAVLLAPQNADGGYNSELFFGMGQSNTFKLVETGNITKVDGKYVMAYSTGAYNQSDYKSGLAWSDTLIPAKGSSYRRILRHDDKQVWADHPGSSEVDYLMQSETKEWPNYVGDKVIAPGVPSVVESGGSWYLYFAGYLPSDAPKVAGGKYDASHRRPFVMPLKVDVPAGASVRKASDADLAGWITWA